MACHANPNYSGVGHETDYYDAPYYDSVTGEPCIPGATPQDYGKDLLSSTGIGVTGLFLLGGLALMVLLKDR